jgi:hypothetical protein
VCGLPFGWFWQIFAILRLNCLFGKLFGKKEKEALLDG